MNAPAAAISTWLVSNRLPYRLDDLGSTLERTDGGLVTALLPVHQAGSSWWVGQGGFPASPELASRLETERVVDVAIPPGLAKDHYSGASNGAIWPLFHYFPEIAVFVPAEWTAYRAVNQAFADAILARAKPGDRVWIHDFQLMLLPAMLRAREASLVIGYFHHIPFPASEVLKIHPARDELINGLLGADLVGFHTLEYARHFAGSAARLLGIEAVAEELHVEDRLVRVGAFPLGIDAQGVLAAMDTAEHALAKERILSQLGGRRLILGVDRLDYTKGILERLAAFERFLRLHPQWRDRVTFVQLCVPSRIEVERYERLRQAVEREVGRINGELGTTGHAPISYLFQRRGLDDLTALYRVADVCLVTPLRDGLNLVCKEYAAASEDLDAVLVLSEFAGAAEEMGEALVVNPYDTEAVAMAIARALEMPLAERRQRMGALRQRVLEADNRDWSRGFLQAMDEVDRRNRANASRDLAGAELE
ncbi:MAG: trehalose-6-phosphate synthase, partial [Planctomycetes bacterium]|nr:trehalose-6-phosphate synthase [Planctomycetota bacterium]